MAHVAKPTVVQHRVSRAADASFPPVEVDVVVSSDRVPFVHHAYQVDGLGMAYLRSSNELQAAGVCTLEAFLDQLDRSGVAQQVLIDVRSGFQAELVPHRAIVRTLARTSWTDRALIVDWDWELVSALRRAEPGVRVGAAMRGRLPGLDTILDAGPVDEPENPDAVLQLGQVAWELGVNLEDRRLIPGDDLDRYRRLVIDALGPLDARGAHPEICQPALEWARPGWGHTVFRRR